MIQQDINDFNKTELNYRLHRGGLPPFFLSKDYPEYQFQEWIDAFWTKDIQQLFALERQYSFQKFVELIFTQSGGIFEATSYARPCEVSRSTITNYLKVLEATAVVSIVRPFSSRRSTEIITAPKVYAFDTGFVSYFKGWDKLRLDDIGFLWEHYVLNEIYAHTQIKKVHYWRTKHGNEVDFVILPRGGDPITIECKRPENGFDPKNIFAFRRRYPKGENFVVTIDSNRTYTKQFGNIRITFLSLTSLIKKIV